MRLVNKQLEGVEKQTMIFEPYYYTGSIPKILYDIEIITKM